MTADTHDTLILGVGNPLMGDDALGIWVVQQLRERPDLPPHVTVVDGGTEGIGLIPVMEPYRRVILVDAAEMGLPPGTIRRLTWPEIRLTSQANPLSLHQSSLADALVLAEALDSLPGEVVIYGVQPHNKGWDQPISAPVQRVLPGLIESLMNEVRSSDTHDEKDNFGH